MIRRTLESAALDALSDTPVVFLHGGRQTGKSTLARHIAAGPHPARYLTLDDAAPLAAARHDPAAFLAGLDGPVVIDEVQRAPELFLALKAQVDRNRAPGRFLLTGSTHALVLPDLAAALAGRMETLTLWPFSQSEVEGAAANLVDALFADRLPAWKPSAPPSVELRVLRGGYPDAFRRARDDRRGAWFGAYVTTILQRDVRDLANIDRLADLPRLLSLVATRAGSLLNFADLSRSMAIPQTTMARYLDLLGATFLTCLAPAWSTNVGKRFTRSPKIYLSDTGLLSHLLGLDRERLKRDRTWMGPLLENFVVMELAKLAGWSASRASLHHFRLAAGQEVDVVLEKPSGEIAGVEVKASATIGPRDFNGLRTLAEIAGPRFRRGVVLYTGDEAVSFGPRLHALPVGVLWRDTAGAASRGKVRH